MKPTRVNMALMQQEIDGLKLEITLLRKGTKGDYDLDAWLNWAKEKHELKAQVDRFESHIRDAIADPEIAQAICCEALLLSPAQSLAEVQAEAIYYALQMVYHEEDDHRGYYSYEGLKLHADHIRQQAQESKS